MKNNKIQEAKKLLQDNGYQVANLWNIVDVQSRFNCTDEEALEVLEEALTNEATMEQIWYAINLSAEEYELVEI